MLLQDDDIAGLQIKYKEEWFLVKPIPDALVGDVIEAWSNGIYKSIEHRAITSNKKARMSLATSVIANEVVEIGPLQEMVEDDVSLIFHGNHAKKLDAKNGYMHKSECANPKHAMIKCRDDERKFR
ncbi:codeine O-demethylase-like [Asparagus officinalis]|uniref:codeine O-demethylase-like n=1 Tax=Asparagus officinalis TaxID=4686 RepID=UPI00098DEC71|nr:codeine O-demethylase-like [Asparagus officinalis]